MVKVDTGWPSSWGETHPHTAHPVKTLWRQESADPVSISPSFATRKSFPLSHLSPSCCTGAHFLLRGSAAVKEPLGTEPAQWGLGLPDADSYFCFCPGVHVWPCSRRQCDLLWWPPREVCVNHCCWETGSPVLSSWEAAGPCPLHGCGFLHVCVRVPATVLAARRRCPQSLFSHEAR